jgi:hypothetical protein
MPTDILATARGNKLYRLFNEWGLNVYGRATNVMEPGPASDTFRRQWAEWKKSFIAITWLDFTRGSDHYVPIIMKNIDHIKQLVTSSQHFMYHYMNNADRSDMIETLERRTTLFENEVGDILREPAINISNESNHLEVSQITDAIMCSLYSTVI